MRRFLFRIEKKNSNGQTVARRLLRALQSATTFSEATILGNFFRSHNRAPFSPRFFSKNPRRFFCCDSFPKSMAARQRNVLATSPEKIPHKNSIKKFRANYFPNSFNTAAVSVLTMLAPATNVPMVLPIEESKNTNRTRVMRFE